jgi:uncharacterized Zn finger protein
MGDHIFYSPIPCPKGQHEFEVIKEKTEKTKDGLNKTVTVYRCKKCGLKEEVTITSDF